MLTYVFLTYLPHRQFESNMEQSLNDMRHFLNERPPDAINTQVSKIHIME